MTPPTTKNKKQQTQKTNKNKKLLRIMSGFSYKRVEQTNQKPSFFH